MNKLKENSGELLLVIASLIILGAVHIWAPVCGNFLELKSGNMVHMRCHYFALFASYMSILMIGMAVESIFITKKSFGISTIIIGVLLWIAMQNTHYSIGICKMKTMACIGTSKWIKGAVVLIIASGILGLKKHFRQK